MKRIALPAALAALAVSIVFNLTPAVVAQSTESTTRIQGLVKAGTSPVGSINPALIGVSDGTTLRAAHGDSSGNMSIVGPAADDASASGNPFVVAGKDTSGVVRVFNVTPAGSSVGSTPKTAIVGGRDAGNLARPLPVAAIGGTAPTDILFGLGGKTGAGLADVAALETTTNALHTTQGFNAVLDTITYSGQVTSNGTSYVTVFTGVSAKRVILLELLASNADTVSHTVDIRDNGTGTILATAKIPSGSTGSICGPVPGTYRTTGLGSLQARIDSGGTGTTVTFTGSAVIK